MTPRWQIAWNNQMDEDLIDQLRACAKGLATLETNRGKLGVCDDAADALAAAKEAISRLEAEGAASITMARNEALEDAANVLESFAGWGLGWDRCAAHVAKEIRAMIAQ